MKTEGNSTVSCEPHQNPGNFKEKRMFFNNFMAPLSLRTLGAATKVLRVLKVLKVLRECGA